MSFLRGYARKRVAFECEGPSKVVDTDAYKTDVNWIVSQYIKTGDASIFNQRVGSFGDVSDVEDIITCRNVIRDAEESFATLPAKIRDAFGNDPAQLLEALQDASQTSRLRELGILVPEAKASGSTGGSAADAATAAKEASGS